MILEEALALKKGTRLVATLSWIAPEQCTEGKIYVMRGDARAVWPGKNFFDPTSEVQLRPDDTPCNAELPIIDDRGKLAYPTYHGFSVAE